MLLKDKVAVVTGSGRGIGRGIALALAREGAKVVVNDVGCEVDGRGGADDPAQQVVNEIKALGSDAAPNYDSVSDFAAAERIIKTAVEQFGRIDILVNNAGIVRDRSMAKMSEDDFDAVLAVHLKGLVQLRPSRAAAHEGAGLRPRDQHHLQRRPARQFRPDQLRRRQGRDHGPHAGVGDRAREVRHHGQRHGAGGHDPHDRHHPGHRQGQPAAGDEPRAQRPAHRLPRAPRRPRTSTARSSAAAASATRSSSSRARWR